METKDKLATFREIFEELRDAGKVRTQGEFADLMGVSRNAVSLAMNGREQYLTSSLITKAHRLRQQLLLGERPVKTHHVAPERDEAPAGIYIPKETIAFYESLAKTAENLSAIVARLMPAAAPQQEDKKSGISPK